MQCGRDLLVAFAAGDRLGHGPLRAGEPGVVWGQGRGGDAYGVTATEAAGVLHPEGRLGTEQHSAALPVRRDERCPVPLDGREVADQRLERDRDVWTGRIGR